MGKIKIFVYTWNMLKCVKKIERVNLSLILDTYTDVLKKHRGDFSPRKIPSGKNGKLLLFLHTINMTSCKNLNRKMNLRIVENPHGEFFSHGEKIPWG